MVIVIGIKIKEGFKNASAHSSNVSYGFFE